VRREWSLVAATALRVDCPLSSTEGDRRGQGKAKSMRIGVGGGIGPVRVGVSTSGGGCLEGIAYFIVFVFLAALVSPPYLLGTWVAVQLGAGPESTARSVTGWAFEAAAVLTVLGILVARGRRAAARREQQELEERWQQASAEYAQLTAELQALEATYDGLLAHPGGVTDASVKPNEKLLAAFSDAHLLEPRSAHRGGPRVQSPVDAGKVVVSDVAVRFLGNSKNVEWRFDKMLDLRIDQGGFVFTVTNRQLVSGVRASLTARASLLASLRWAAALSSGAGLAAAQSKVEAIRLALLEELEAAERELTDRWAELSAA
jgi:hypothetical protein